MRTAERQTVGGGWVWGLELEFGLCLDEWKEG
jgi:hypothetical protein